ncbi:MAG: hypothetical protein QXI12_00375 [Candidatus Methanomethyliaceae archaeon]
MRKSIRFPREALQLTDTEEAVLPDAEYHPTGNPLKQMMLSPSLAVGRLLIIGEANLRVPSQRDTDAGLDNWVSEGWENLSGTVCSVGPKLWLGGRNAKLLRGAGRQSKCHPG